MQRQVVQHAHRPLRPRLALRGLQVAQHAAQRGCAAVGGILHEQRSCDDQQLHTGG